MKLIYFFAFACFLIGCQSSNESALPGRPQNEKLVQTDFGIVVTDKNEYYQAFLNSDAYEYAYESLGGFQVSSIQLIDYPQQRSKGLAIKINPANGFSRDIFVNIAPSSTGSKIVGLLREHNIKGRLVDGILKPEGTVNWHSLTGGKINTAHFSAGKLDKFATFKLNSSDRVTKAPPCCWACTEAQFNATYSYYKNECESDAVCDFSCSFNPCALAYMASAVAACTECGSANP